MLARLDVPGDRAFAFEHRDKQLVLWNVPLAGQQFPRMPIASLLEVVAEREVAEHLEERVVAGRRPDVLEIVVLSADAHALLARRRTGVVAPLFAEEHVLELVHPGVGEEQRRVVVRHERRAGHDSMAVPLEILQKRRANLSPGHVSEHHFTVEPRGHEELEDPMNCYGIERFSSARIAADAADAEKP